MDKNLIRGLISNCIGLPILFGFGYAVKLQHLAAAALAINWLVFAVHALPRNSERFFDATGSLTYLVLIGSAVSTSQGCVARRFVSASMVVVWCIRLGSYLLGRILKDGKDSRFDEFRKSWLRFLGVWTIQAIWCFFVASPALVMITSDACHTSVSILDCVGWAIWLVSFGMEVVADRQKDRFRRDPANKGKFITTGLWAYSRHPNYFGEICMWIGICISGSSCFHGLEWLAWVSPLTTWILLMKVSGVPLLEKTGQERWGSDPEYQHYMKNTPCIIPALRKPQAYPIDGYVRVAG